MPKTAGKYSFISYRSINSQTPNGRAFGLGLARLENLVILGAIVASFMRKYAAVRYTVVHGMRSGELHGAVAFLFTRPRAQLRADKSSYVCACYLKEMYCMLNIQLIVLLTSLLFFDLRRREVTSADTLTRRF